MPGVRLPLAIVLAFGVALVGQPAGAAERTFMFTAADVVRMIDEFNADVLAHSAELDGAAKIRLGAVSVAGKSCPSLALHPERLATRLRVLEGPERAAALAARRPNAKLAAALTTMGATVWTIPGRGRTHRAGWATELSILAPAFSTAGYARGDSAGGISGMATGDVDASFVVDLNVTTPSADPAELVLAVTTELPRKTPTGKPKRTDCFLVTAAPMTDLQALEDLLGATTIPEPTATRLASLLLEASNWLHQTPARPDRAALMIKRFGIRVASLSSTDVPADAAEALIIRALAVSEALNF